MFVLFCMSHAILSPFALKSFADPGFWFYERWGLVASEQRKCLLSICWMHLVKVGMATAACLGSCKWEKPLCISSKSLYLCIFSNWLRSACGPVGLAGGWVVITPFSSPAAVGREKCAFCKWLFQDFWEGATAHYHHAWSFSFSSET